MSFVSLGLSKAILQAIEDCGYPAPTPIQIKTVPAALAGKDIMAAAQTGTGKTASFTWPLLQRLANGGKVRANHIRALILTPTRELAMQVAESVTIYGINLPLKCKVVYGGVKINPQMMQLRGGVDVLVATPGRLLDLFGQNAVKFSQVETLVLDEADRMLDLGFREEIRKILTLLPRKRQNLLFSATLSDDIRKLAEPFLKNPVLIEVCPRNSTAKGVKQLVYEVDKGKKTAMLSHLIRNQGWQQGLVFTRTKIGADRLVQELARDGVLVAAIHGDKSQHERTRALTDFKENKTQILIATDIAARGIDINELSHVINFDLPKVPEDYIHRIGRTARAGADGIAISMVSADEVRQLAMIETLIRQTLVREVVNGFIPKHAVPLTQPLKLRAKKPKKPKKQATDRRAGEELTTEGNRPHRGDRTGEEGRATGRTGKRERQRHEYVATAPIKKRR
ncbi:MAG: DEAD/DEAH box helicase [Desulfobulbaceae bacterium]|nr:DEAD/DEAH box helicase [Desulfobulbaceae bacterium]